MSYGEPRAVECFTLLSNETIKIKQFFRPAMEDVYIHMWTQPGKSP